MSFGAPRVAPSDPVMFHPKYDASCEDSSHSLSSVAAFEVALLHVVELSVKCVICRGKNSKMRCGGQVFRQRRGQRRRSHGEQP